MSCCPVSRSIVFILALDQELHNDLDGTDNCPYLPVDGAVRDIPLIIGELLLTGSIDMQLSEVLTVLVCKSLGVSCEALTATSDIRPHGHEPEPCLSHRVFRSHETLCCGGAPSLNQMV